MNQNVDLLDLSGTPVQPQPMGIPTNPFAGGFVNSAMYGQPLGGMGMPGVAGIPQFAGMGNVGFGSPQPRVDTQLLGSTQ